MKKIVIVFTLIFSWPIIGQEYAVSLLDLSLFESANSITRLEEKLVEIKKVNKMKTTYKSVVTVLNKAGNDNAADRVFYRNDLTIKSLNAKILDKNGEVIEQFKKKDFKDLSAVSNSALYTDSRYYVLDYTPKDYPYTLILEYESINKNTLHLRPWLPRVRNNNAVEKSVYEIKDDAKLGIVYRAKNIDNNENIKITSTTNALKFEASNLPALKSEAYMPSMDNSLGRLMLGLNSSVYMVKIQRKT